jgi:polyisoprenoid-binding protein YceI
MTTMTTRWNIDAAHSSIHFSIRHMVFSKVRGRFAAYTGPAASSSAIAWTSSSTYRR